MLLKTPRELSKEYYQFVDGFTKTDFEDEKLLGKFYTDYGISKKHDPDIVPALYIQSILFANSHN